VDNWIGIASAIISVVGAIVAGVLTTWSNRRSHEQTKAEQAAQLLSRYREPLLLAANSLQSRIYNVIRDDYLPVYLRSGDREQEDYARRFTVYTLAEYLCWVEIIRRELRFLDLGAEEENREFTRLLLAVTNNLSDKSGPETHFRLFRGQQRALGELMMVRITGTSEHECLTYPEFSRRLDGEDAFFSEWFLRLLKDVDVIADAPIDRNERLVRTQWALIDLIDFLDPAKIRLGADHRAKYEWTAPVPAPSTSPSF
jgi:hypothetical protein